MTESAHPSGALAPTDAAAALEPGIAADAAGAVVRTPGSEDAVHVELRSISKRFDAVVALDDVSLVVKRGTIHGLVGENGAGKSTLGKIVAGVVRPDAGVLLVEGREASYGSPRDALRDRITIVQQEVGLIPRRSVLENVFLGLESGPRGMFARRRARRWLDELNRRTGFDLPADAKVGDLRIPDQQRVEILRAIAREAKLIVVDEATASLTATETTQLLEVLRDLRQDDTTVVYISHYLGEILELADEVTILRSGRVVRTSATRDETSETLVEAMLGRAADVAFADKQPPPRDAPVVLSARGLKRAGAIRDVSLDIRRGEIVGLAGLVGSGRSEVARAIFGADRVDAGEVHVGGRALRLGSPRGAVRAGIAMLPEDRKNQGLLMRRALYENITLPQLGGVSRAGVLLREREQETTLEALRGTDVRPADPRATVAALSGGNQQKVLFAKWLLNPPTVLLADEPTRGVDIGAKLAIYELIRSLAHNGMAVLLISSEIEEILGLAHRALVMWRGSVVAEFDESSMSEERLLRAAFGGDPEQRAGESSP